MLEQGYLCWHLGQTEADAKEVKAKTMEEAAQLAVDIWRHEKLKELGPDKVTVFVKDIDNTQKKFQVSRKGHLDAPEAFL